MEVVYKNTSYKSRVASKKRLIKPQEETRSHQDPFPFELERGDEGIMEQKMEPLDYLESNDEEASARTESCYRSRGSSDGSGSDVEGGCAIVDGRLVGAAYDDHHTSAINGIVLEYLELLGLEDTYKCFWNECTKNRIPLPLRIRDPIFRRTKFGRTEIDTFFVHYDNWEGDDLLHDWSKFSEEAEDKGNPTFRQISILLRIFIASLPFRKNEDSAYKINALDELREFHQAYSEEFTKDPVCLPLFAFPFVSDPTVHPAFTVVFTNKWQMDLRKQLETLFDKHLESHNTYGVSRCDLKQMYHHYTEIPHTRNEAQQVEKILESALTERSEHTNADSESVCESTVTTTERTSCVVSSSRVMAPETCTLVKKSLVQTQDRYCKLLSATSAVVKALEQVVQGKAQDIQVLESQLQISFPELFSPNMMCERDTKTITYKLPQRPLLTVAIATEPERSRGQVEELVLEEVEADSPQPPGSQNTSIGATEETSGRDPEEEEGDEKEDSSGTGNSEESEQETNTGGSESGEENESSSGRDTFERSQHTSGTVSQACSPRFQDEMQLDSARSSVASSQTKSCKQAGDAKCNLKLTDSTPNTRVVEISPEQAEKEEREIPEEFCQYFQGLASPKAQQKIEECSENQTRSLLPPSVSDPFPSPPRTYEVSPRSSKIIYIPSSVDVGCSSTNTTGRVPVPRSASISASGNRNRHRNSSLRRSPSSSPHPEMRQLSARGVNPGRGNWEPEKPQKVQGIAKAVMPIPPPQEALLLPNRVLTPPPDKKSSTAMASIMGVLGVSSPTPASPSSGGSPASDPRKERVIRKTVIKAARNSSSDTKRASNKPTAPPRSTQTQPVVPSTRKAGIITKSMILTKKKYAAIEAAAQPQPHSRIYKMSSNNVGVRPAELDSALMTVKSIGHPGGAID